MIPKPKFGPFDLKSLRQDSLRRALFASAFGNRLKLSNSEDLFAGALLQDMAIPLLLKELPAEVDEPTTEFATILKLPVPKTSLLDSLS